MAESRLKIASLGGQRREAHEFLRGGIAWGYINHKRVVQLLTPEILNSVPTGLLQSCIDRGIVDSNGIIIKPKTVRVGEHFTQNSIYDWFPYGDDHALHALYSLFVDGIAKRLGAIHIEEAAWRKSFVRNCVAAGDPVFFVRGQYFRKETETAENAHVHVLARKGDLHVEYFIDTRDMFGTTSMTVSFSGHETAASLLLVKSIKQEEKLCTLHCTPIALGIGFHVREPTLDFAQTEQPDQPITSVSRP